MAGFAYPYDPTGQATTNLVIGERYKLADYSNLYRCVVPLMTPFYRDDLIIKHVESGRFLLEGIDYYLGYHYQEASTVTKQAIYGSIVVHDTALKGTIEFTKYRTLGGAYTQRKTDLDAFLAKEPMRDPRNVDFTEVMKWPHVVEPIYEPTTPASALAADPVLAALGRYEAVLKQINDREKSQFVAIFDRMAALTDKVRAYQFDGHYYGADPHSVTYQQLSALGKDQTAKDTLTAYGFTLTQLVLLINQMGITQENVDQYYHLIGGAFDGRISFTEGNTCTIQNQVGTSYINISTGQITIAAVSNISIAGDSDKSEMNVGTAIQSGNNTLTIHSKKNTQANNSAVYNGYYLITVANIAQYVSSTATSAALELFLSDNTLVDLNGGGTPTNPLTGVVTFPEASFTTQGMLQLTDNVLSNSTTLGVSATALFTASQAIAKFVPVTRKVAGHALSTNITVSKADIGLGQVDNTAMVDKPLPSAFVSTITTEKALKGHKHNLTELTGVPIATETVSGVVRLDSTLSDAVTTAATISLGKQVNDALNVTQANTDKKLSARDIPIIEWGKKGGSGLITDGVYIASIAGWVIAFKAIRVIAGSVATTTETLNLEELFPGAMMSTTFYLSLDTSLGAVNSNIVASTTQPMDTETSSYLGYIRTNNTTIYDTKINAQYRIINDADLLRHIDSVNAHGHLRTDKGAYGLSNIENKSLVDEVEPVSFADVFNSWYRFSHSPAGIYPASATDTASWAYDAVTDSITSTVNSNTYIGFISLDNFGDFEFDTILSSNINDDDSIGVVIGFYKDPITGKEHTLNFIRNANLGSNYPSSVRLTFNENQADFWSIQAAGPVPTASNWNTVGTTRLRVIRAGDSYTCYAYGFTALEGDVLIATWVLDLNSDPRLAVFKGTTKFGYSCASQANATFKNLVRPDEDGRSYYASEWAVRSAKNKMEADLAFTEGTVISGATIPLPLGFTLAQCYIHLVPANLTAAEIEQFECYADDTGTAHCHVKLVTDPYWTAGTAKYYLFGVK